MTIKFLEAYERNSCLWDVCSPNYKNKEVRENAYENLSRVMNIEGFDVATVKAKIRSIRNAYALERGKVISAKNKDEVYEPKLAWFSVADRILRKVVRTKSLYQTDDTDEPTEIKVVCIFYCNCLFFVHYLAVVTIGITVCLFICFTFCT